MLWYFTKREAEGVDIRASGETDTGPANITHLSTAAQYTGTIRHPLNQELGWKPAPNTDDPEFTMTTLKNFQLHNAVKGTHISKNLYFMSYFEVSCINTQHGAFMMLGVKQRPTTPCQQWGYNNEQGYSNLLCLQDWYLGFLTYF